MSLLPLSPVHECGRTESFLLIQIDWKFSTKKVEQEINYGTTETLFFFISLKEDLLSFGEKRPRRTEKCGPVSPNAKPVAHSALSEQRQRIH